VLLRQLDLSRFKAFQKATLQTAPLTVLIGPNNGGKSTALQAMALVSQTVSSNTQGRLKTDGPLVDLGDDVSSLANDSAARGGAWAIGMSWKPTRDPSDQGPEIGFELQAIQNRTQGFTTSAWVRQNFPPGRIVQASVVAGSNQQKLKVTAPRLATTNFDLPPLDKDVDVHANSPWQWQLGGLPPRQIQSQILSGEPDAIVAEILLVANPYFSGGIAEQLQAFHYVGPDRQVVRSVYPLGSGDVIQPQSAEEVINRLAHSDDILFEVSERLRRTFEYGLDKTLRTPQQFPRPIQGSQVALVGTGKNNRRRLLVNMGAGFAQFGWIAMQLEIARMPRFLLNPESPPPTPLVAVEEPELHLHPRLQPAMASMLAEFAMRDGQVVCSTQSEHFLLAVLELVAEQTLKPQDVSVYYLDAEHGVVDRLDVDQKGQMKGGLKGFFEENERQVERQIELLRKSADLGS
jgi:hypothetical protein